MQKLYLTKEQEQILDIQKTHPDTGICNIGATLCFDYKFDRQILKHILQTFMQNTDILKIRINSNYEPYISDDKIEIKKWFTNRKPTDDELSEWLSKPFDFTDGELYELRTYEDSENMLLFVKIHHILMDGCSASLWMRECEKYCMNFKAGHLNAPVSVNSFIDCMKKKNENKPEDTDWFRNIAKDFNSDLWKMKQPSHHNPIAVASERKLPENIYRELKNVSKKQRLSTEVIIGTALMIYISGITSSSQVAIGRTMLNRSKEELNMYGVKANTIPVFMGINSEENYFELCKKVKFYFFDMLRHSGFSVREYQLKEEITGSYYDVAMSYRNQKYLLTFDGREQNEISNLYSEIPMRLFIYEDENDIRFKLVCQKESYSQAEVTTIADRLINIISQGLKNSKIDDISLLSDSDSKLWEMLNKKDDILEPNDTLPMRIEKWGMTDDGKRIAVKYNDKKMTYKMLEQTACNVAAYLHERGIMPGDVVGIRFETSIMLPAVLYGIWKVGAAFLPISIKDAPKRVLQMNKHCNLVWDSFVTNDYKEWIAVNGNQQWKAKYSNIAYHMCTSGTSGTPKIVIISHHSLICRMEWMQSKYKCGDCVLQKASYTFDVSVWEYFLPLMTGGILVLSDDKKRNDVYYITELLEKNDIKTVHFIPSMLGLFLEYVRKNNIKLPALLHVFSSGEALPSKLAKEFAEIFPDKSLHNLYGPTECTIDVTYFDIDNKNILNDIPIGRPVAWTNIKIADSNGRCVPVGVEGNLIISGSLVGEGYSEDDSQKFFIDENNNKCYDTGDRAVLDFDGLIYYRGRRDNQYKINGMRIDTDQIQSVMLEHPKVLRAVVCVYKNQLIGIYMSHEPIEDLDIWLKSKLSYYSVPSRLIHQRDIPLTKNGKTDNDYIKKLLETEDIKQPTSCHEKILESLVSTKLGRNVSVDENLFLAGLDSLRLMELVLELEQYGMYYSMDDFYQSLTIENIAKQETRGVRWLIKDSSKKLVIAFPYAAGTSETYENIAKRLKNKKIDFCVTKNSELLPDLKKYKRIILLGYCTGTALALRGIRELEKRGMHPSGIILCAAVPPKKGSSSPWEKCNNHQITLFLNYLHGKILKVNDAFITEFRRDTNNFYSFFNEASAVYKVKNITLLFGERDVLTLFFRERWKNWKKYLKGNYRIRLFRNERHFFIEQCGDEIAYEICRCLKNN